MSAPASHQVSNRPVESRRHDSASSVITTGAHCCRADYLVFDYLSSFYSALKVRNQSLGETKRKAHCKEHRVSLTRRRKHSAAGDMEVTDSVHSAASVHNA